MTRLFGKKNDKTTIAELEEYYANQNQNKSRSAKAWFMAILSLLLTIAIIIGLFFVGRWLYNTLTDNNDSPATTGDNNVANDTLPSFDGGEFGQSGANGDNSSAENSGSATSGSESSSQDNQGTVTDQAASTDVSNADRIAATGDSELPNTGAGEIIVLLPLAAGVVGYSISRRRQIKNN
jgi:cobalamin biosynthesis Mg chelatase CobN